MLHTWDGKMKNPAWHETKLGVIMSSNIMEIIQSSDDTHFKIKEKEYVNYFGAVDTFEKLLFAAALRNGYGQHETTVIVSDGAPWIFNMKDKLFPDAIHILDI